MWETISVAFCNGGVNNTHGHVTQNRCVCMGSLCHVLLDAHIGNGTGRRTLTIMASLLLTGPLRYEAVLHSYGTSPERGGGRVGTDL